LLSVWLSGSVGFATTGADWLFCDGDGQLSASVVSSPQPC
jgi:hypothetical protein